MPFRDVIGHRRVLALIARAVARDTLPPSLIFAGPSGVGKRLVAVATAQALNCIELAPQTSSPAPTPSLFEPAEPPELPELPEPPEPLESPEALESQNGPDACGVCRACERIARGSHPDVVIVEPGDSGSIKVDVIRDVIDRVGYRPFEGRRRVVIIDDAEAMVASAQNALLKTLEEPPSASVFILISSRADSLLPTVRSRCPRLRFHPLSADEVTAALVAHGKKRDEAMALAATADGSVGQALEASAGELIDARDAALRVLLHAAASDDPRRRLDGAKELLGRGDTVDRHQLSAYLRSLAALLRDVEVLATGADAGVLANPDIRQQLERLRGFGGDRGVRAFRTVDEALTALTRNAGVKIVSDWVLVNL